jgi:tripartite-type tricarboxylate transporter receptor subunit TctC
VALLQGNVALVVDSYSVLQGNIADGKLKALASSGAVRSESTPDLATVQESGVAEYDVVSWNALFARTGTPPEVIKTLNAALQDILADAETKKKMLALGIEAKAGTPEAIEQRLTSDIEKWRAVIEKAKIPKQ